MATQTDSLMTLRELAEYLNLEHWTLYKMARSGRVPAIRMGRTWRFRKAEIAQWLDQQRTGPRLVGGPEEDVQFGSYDLGIKGALTREQIYGSRR